MNATTVSRRQMLVTTPAAAATMTGGAATASADDPVFVAIERHRQAIQARLLALRTDQPDEISNQLLTAEGDAFLVWLTTPPTTMAGVIATLDHASRRPSDNLLPGDYTYAHLAESAQYFGNIRKAGEQFPAMIAAALRQIFGNCDRIGHASRDWGHRDQG
jgi:hypothetical protein